MIATLKIIGTGVPYRVPGARTSLGTLFFAAQFVDLLWPILLLLGVERVAIRPGITRVTPLDFESYPISHSLVMSLVWGAIVGTLYAVATRRLRGALVVGLCVVSHWLLDLLVHRPDLPIGLGEGPKVGLGLWSSLTATVLVEGAIFAGGLLLYARASRPLDRIGSIALWALAAFLVLIQIANLFGPPPENWAQIAWVGHAQWLLVLWAWWVDRHRTIAIPEAS